MAKPSTIDEVPLNTPYTEEYKRVCFEVFYKNNRPAAPTLFKLIPDDERKRKPHVSLLRNWRNEQGWDNQADVLDARAMGIMDNDLVGVKVKMLQEQASKGKELQTLGIDYLREEGFDTASAAVQAVVRGANLERTSRGLSDAFAKIAQMDDAKLTNAFMRLLEKGQKGDTSPIIDVAEEKDESEESDA